MHFVLRAAGPLLVLAAAACGGDTQEGTVRPLDGHPDRTVLVSASDSVDVDGERLSVRGEAWVNAMPGNTASDRILATALLSTTTRRPSATLEHLYVVHGSDVWDTPFDDIDTYDEKTVQGTVREGPTWHAGDHVDVVVRVRGRSGTSAFLAVRDAPITLAQ